MARARIPSGTFRIKKSPSGRWGASGRDARGKKFVQYFATEGEANTYAKSKVPSVSAFQKQDVTTVTDNVIRPPVTSWSAYDPLQDETPIEISDDNRNAVNAALGFAPDVPAINDNAGSPVTPIDIEKRKRQNQSLCEFMGHGMAVVSCGLIAWSAKQFRYEAARPSAKQLKELGEAYADQFKEWFTDVDLKPWHRICMLTFVIAFGMCMQGRKMPKLEVVPSTGDSNTAV